jgi:enoyl-CoA hydratase/carnithine racemase
MSTPRRYYPLNARQMAVTCRKLADDLRAEHAMGWGLIHLSADTGGIEYMITRAEAADSLDEQAERWLEEVATGRPNTIDRARIGW